MKQIKGAECKEEKEEKNVLLGRKQMTNEEGGENISVNKREKRAIKEKRIEAVWRRRSK